MLSSSAKMLVGSAMALAFTFFVGMAAAHYVTFFYVWLGFLLLLTVILLAGTFVKFAFRVEFSHKVDAIPYEDMVPLQHFSCSSINEALRFIGVQSTPDLDEFDVIGLGRWRSNEDFYE